MGFYKVEVAHEYSAKGAAVGWRVAARQDIRQRPGSNHTAEHLTLEEAMDTFQVFVRRGDTHARVVKQGGAETPEHVVCTTEC